MLGLPVEDDPDAEANLPGYPREDVVHAAFQASYCLDLYYTEEFQDLFDWEERGGEEVVTDEDQKALDWLKNLCGLLVRRWDWKRLFPIHEHPFSITHVFPDHEWPERNAAWHDAVAPLVESSCREGRPVELPLELPVRHTGSRENEHWWRIIKNWPATIRQDEAKALRIVAERLERLAGWQSKLDRSEGLPSEIEPRRRARLYDAEADYLHVAKLRADFERILGEHPQHAPDLQTPPDHTAGGARKPATKKVAILGLYLDDHRQQRQRSDRDIARAIDAHPAYVSRVLKPVRDLLRAQAAGEMPRGRRGTDGNIEAWGS